MESSQALTAAEPVVFKKRSAKSTFRKRPATPPHAGDDTDSSAYSSSEDEVGYKVKRRKKNTGVITGSSKTDAASTSDLTSTLYIADRNATIKSVNDATKQSN
jgi:RING finger protein 113A